MSIQVAKHIFNNRIQFTNHKLSKFLMDFDINHAASLIEYSQTNGQTEVPNKVILTGLKKQLRAAKGKWTKELLEAL